jgi:hypothetical protein
MPTTIRNSFSCLSAQNAPIWLKESDKRFDWDLSDGVGVRRTSHDGRAA